MKLKDLINAIDNSVPVWINVEPWCDRYDSILEVDAEDAERVVEYITTDAENEITIELV